MSSPMPDLVTCEDCEGTGHVPDSAQPCPWCLGSGLIEASQVPEPDAPPATGPSPASIHLERAKAGLEGIHQITRENQPGTVEWEVATLALQNAQANALVAIAECLMDLTRRAP
jgi:DnaJ-class molecular chaperone